MRIGLDPLIVYAVKRIQDLGEECTFERLVYESFSLFPKKFAFLRYPQWPDATRINKSWLRCRTDKGWIVGSVQEGFRLTPAGCQVAGEVERILYSVGTHDAKAKKQPEHRSRSREESALRHIRESDYFKRWAEHQTNFTISWPEFLSLLNTTLETPRRILRQNLHFYRQVAAQLGDSEVLAFINASAQQHESSLREAPSVKGQNRNGQGR
jgi:hypothetical protein